MNRASDNALPLFPESPGFKERGGTSEAAAAIAAETAPALRDNCLRLIAAAPGGLTAHQVAAAMDWEICSIRARISELYALGRVRKGDTHRDSDRRASSVVWVAVPACEVEEAAASVRATARARAMARSERALAA